MAASNPSSPRKELDKQEQHPRRNVPELAGNMMMEVQGEDISPDEYHRSTGWICVGSERPSRSKDQDVKQAERAPSRTYAKKVTATATKAARMPYALPREERKVIIRPRGGLNIARTPTPAIQQAILRAAGMGEDEAAGDSMCPNKVQNIMIISTPDDTRAMRYARILSLTVADQEHEVGAYITAPEWTSKGVIKGVPVEYTPEEITRKVVNSRNPLARGAARIGTSQAVTILFEGQKVPRVVHFGLSMMQCTLYKKHFDVCRNCRTVGHRTDVCPHPKMGICYACGTLNPTEDHEESCKPVCKLCRGNHPTGNYQCRNRYKTPYLVTKRQWEQKQASQANPARKPGPPGPADFPSLAPTQKGVGSQPQLATTGRQSRSKSRDRVSWADVTGSRGKIAPKQQVRQRSSSRSAARQPQAQPRKDDEVAALRSEFQKLQQTFQAQQRMFQEQQQSLQGQLAQVQRENQELKRKLLQAEGRRGDEETPKQAATTPNTPDQPRPALKRRATENHSEAIGTDADNLHERMDKLEAHLKHQERKTNARFDQIAATLQTLMEGQQRLLHPNLNQVQQQSGPEPMHST